MKNHEVIPAFEMLLDELGAVVEALNKAGWQPTTPKEKCRSRGAQPT